MEPIKKENEPLQTATPSTNVGTPVCKKIDTSVRGDSKSGSLIKFRGSDTKTGANDRLPAERRK